MPTFSYLAPPGGLYGPWQTVHSHTGSFSFTITFETIGDSGARGLVRYGGDNGEMVEQDFYDTHTFTTGDAYADIKVKFKSMSPMGVALQGDISP
jgi:hypothetical protein